MAYISQYSGEELDSSIAINDTQNTRLTLLETENANLNTQLEKIFPIGACYTTSTNTSPADYLGGTWTLIDKRFTPAILSSTTSGTYFTYNTTNCSALNQCYIRRFDHGLDIQISVTTDAAYADTALEVGTINYSAIGITRLPATTYIIGTSDAGNGFSNSTVNYSTGVITHQDCVTKTSGGSLTTSTALVYKFTVLIPMGYMDDTVCN